MKLMMKRGAQRMKSDLEAKAGGKPSARDLSENVTPIKGREDDAADRRREVLLSGNRDNCDTDENTGKKEVNLGNVGSDSKKGSGLTPLPRL